MIRRARAFRRSSIAAGLGPIAGITAALQRHPKAAWLVVACDLPFLTRALRI